MSEDKNEETSGASCGCGGGSCCTGPGKWILIVLVLAIAGVLIAKNSGKKEGTPGGGTVTNNPPAVVGATGEKTTVSESTILGKSLPRLVDLGATKCIPCKMMAPILAELKKTYAEKMDVVFIDVWEDPAAGEKFGIKMIPTQVFYDANGKEVFRHEGFYAKEDILAKWKELGVDLPVGNKE